MYRGRLHSENRLAAVTDELIEHRLGIIVLTVGKSCKRAYSDNVAVGGHHRYSLEKMLALVSVHYHAAFGFQFPCTGVHIEHDDVHAEVHRGFLCAQACAQRVVEKYHQQCLVLAEMLIFESVVFYLLCFGERKVEVTDVFYVDECSHIVLSFKLYNRISSALPPSQSLLVVTVLHHFEPIPVSSLLLHLGRSGGASYSLICPSPSMSHLYVVISSRPIGPLGPSF